MRVNDGHTSAAFQSNAGYSGTPLWKLKQQGAVPKINAQEQHEAEEQKKLEKALDEAAEKKIICEIASLGRGDAKPLAHTVMIKDLRLIAARNRVSLPNSGLLENRGALALFGMFDGQSCAGAEPGSKAAEFCAQQIHVKLIRNLSAIPEGRCTEVFLKATLMKTFEDLDKDMLSNFPDIQDGCGGAVALLAGSVLFTGVVGRSCAVVRQPMRGEPNPAVKNLGAQQGRCNVPADKKYLEEQGCQVFEGADNKWLVSSPTVGAAAAVSRSLGDRAWKGEKGLVAEGPALLRHNPEASITTFNWDHGEPCLMIGSAPIADTISDRELGDVLTEYVMRPRAASQEIAARAADASRGSSQCAALVLFLMDPNEGSKSAESSAKRMKMSKESASVRLRHILVKHHECSNNTDPVRNKPVTRTMQEAEAVLRMALKELLREARATRMPSDAKKAQMAALAPTSKYLALCKELSECSSAQKGGGMCGDLGWLSDDQLRLFGPSFSEAAKSLPIGMWSDLTTSSHGIHLMQRIA